jgi:DNA-binding protein HU-beta
MLPPTGVRTALPCGNAQQKNSDKVHEASQILAGAGIESARLSAIPDFHTGGICMNKSELIEIAAKEADISKAAAERALSAMIGAVVKAVSKGDSVALIGFGTFKSAKRAARTGKNPKTGAAIKIPATTVPKFSAGATFKAAVAGKKAAKKK